MEPNPFQALARRLDALPSGFPATDDGVELRILESLFTSEEAELAAQLKTGLESVEQIAARTGGDPAQISDQLHSMAQRGLIAAVFTKRRALFCLMPFVVGIYEMQVARLDGELAALFETYYHQAFARMMTAEPHLHRVIPVRQSVRVDYEIQPYESAVEIIEKSRAWGVTDCICRKQKALVGDPCNHPVDVCIWLSTVVGVFDNDSKVRVVSKEEALNTLERAAKAGLIHSTANNQQTIRYICNCCTCSCGFLRGMADLGLANVIARSAFVLEVATEQCLGCESCVEYCQFGALTMDGSVVSVDRQRCVGCGVCTRNCPEDALVLIRRPEHEIKPIPANEAEWGIKRAANRGLDLNPVR